MPCGGLGATTQRLQQGSIKTTVAARQSSDRYTRVWRFTSVAASAFGSGFTASRGSHRLAPSPVRRGLGRVLVVPIPPLVRRGLRVAFRLVLPGILASERRRIEVAPGAPHCFVAAAVDEVGAKDPVAVAKEQLLPSAFVIASIADAFSPISASTRCRRQGVNVRAVVRLRPDRRDNSPCDETEDDAYSEQSQCWHRIFLSCCRRSVSVRTRRKRLGAPHEYTERG